MLLFLNKINKNLNLKYLYFIIIIIFLILNINYIFFINKNNYINFDIDFSTSTDFEDLFIIVSDSLEVIFCDLNLLFDGFIDILFFIFYKKLFNFIVKTLR